MRRVNTGLLFLMLALAGTTTYAQRGIQLGLRVNPQWTSILNGSFADTLTKKMTFGVGVGASVGYGFNDNMSLLVEGWYSSQGQHFTYEYPNPAFVAGSDLPEERTVTREIRMRYLKIPVLFRYGTNTERKYAIYGMLGPQFEYLMNLEDRNNDPRYTYTTDPYVETANFPQEAIDPYNRINVSVVGAFGLDIKLRYNLRMNLQVRADYGLLDIRDTEYTYTERRNGVETELNYWEDHQKITSASNNLNVGLTLGFTYIFIPRFHY